MLQALLTAAAAIAIWQDGEHSIASDRGTPAWTNVLGDVALGFASASQGLQGVLGRRLNSQFGTTCVLTSVWVELIADPKLFWRKFVNSRDHRVYAILGAFLGGFTGCAIIDHFGDAGTFGIGVIFRVIIAFGWLFVPALHTEHVN